MKLLLKNLIFYSTVVFCSIFLLRVDAKTFDNIEHFTLANGLQVVLIKDNLTPIVYHGIFYKVGSADSPYNKTGLAHFVEHLMFKGTKKYPKDSFKLIINNLGGKQNAATSWDVTSYFIIIAKEYLEQAIELEADRMINLLLTPEDVAKELQVVLQERRQEIESNPASLLFEANNTAFFWQHPYGRPVIGFKNHIESYNLEDAKSFYQTWYTPSNAILVIAGNILKKDVGPLIEKYYGKIPNKTVPDRMSLRDIEPEHHKTTIKVELKDTSLDRQYWEACYYAPNHITANINIELAINLLKIILGETSLGRLNKTLVDNQKIAFWASASYFGNMLNPYFFSIYVMPINIIDSQKTEHLVNAEINNLLFNGVSNDELKMAKQHYTNYFRFHYDSVINLAELFGNNLAHNYSINEIKNILNILDEITIKDVNEAAKLIFNNPPRTISYSYPIREN